MTAHTSAVALADIYLRLSNEELNTGEQQNSTQESESIRNQRNIIHQYCDANGITIVKEFVDDGFSGSNFNRPGFTAMLAHLESGAANMVITKDLSRLGRDMIESSNYAERIFPNMGLRYIAISDNFDSADVNLMAPFQFAMNDVYLRDVSRKIKQVLESKRQRGEYCACAPFGYIKNPDDKHRLVPNPETAPIVQRIFSMAANGDSCHKIAQVLTDGGVITPSRYRATTSGNYTARGEMRVVDHWCHTTVKRMLRNEVYLGKTQLGKTKKPSLKSNKKIEVPKDEWCQFENTHTPLVSQTTFDLVQNYLKVHSTNWRDGDNIRRSIFNGLVFCEHCHSAMCSAGTTYKGDRFKYWFLYCNAPGRSANVKCEHRARIRYNDLVQIVLRDFQRFTTLNEQQRNELVRRLRQQLESSNVYQDKRDPKVLETKIESIQKALGKLYIDNASGIIDDNIFATMLQQLTSEMQSAHTELDELRKRQEKTEAALNDCQRFFELIDRYLPITELNFDIVHTFIERIEVGEPQLPEGYKQRPRGKVGTKQNIKIWYKFMGSVTPD